MVDKREGGKKKLFMKKMLHDNQFYIKWCLFLWLIQILISECLIWFNTGQENKMLPFRLCMLFQIWNLFYCLQTKDILTRFSLLKLMTTFLICFQTFVRVGEIFACFYYFREDTVHAM